MNDGMTSEPQNQAPMEVTQGPEAQAADATPASLGGTALKTEVPTPVIGDEHLQPLGTGTTAAAEQATVDGANKPVVATRQGILSRLFHRQ